MSLQKNRFNEEEPSTDGIVTTTVFQTVGEDYSKWKEQDNVNEIERTKQVREHAIATNVATAFTESPQDQPSASESGPTASTSSSDRGGKASASTSRIDVGRTSAASISAIDPRKKPSLFHRFIQLFKGKPLSHGTGVSNQYQLNEIRKKVIESIAIKSSGGPSDVTCIWDYAGQLDYYITHRFFITDGSSYGVVFSLLDALDEFAKPRDHKKGKYEMTNLQTIIFWIRSIYEYAILLHGLKEKPLINGMIASPTISLIGTHKDLLTGSDAEKQAKIDNMFDRIFKELEGTPYERHVDRERYAVDNTTALDEGIQRLKRNVGGFMKAMARTVPINWMDFQIEVQEAGKTTLRMSLDKITKIAVKCGINKENVIHVLNYLNDVGIILYSPTNKKLENTVITNIHMLIGIFMKIITVVKPDDVDKGIKKAASEDGPRVFVVPSRMKTKDDDRLEVKEDEKQTVSIYVTPKDFLPDAVYDILVVRFVSLSQENGYCDDPKLFQNQAKILFDDKHYLRLGRISIDNKRSLKLEILRMKERGADGTNMSACKPHPDVCKEVLQVLKQHLGEVYPSKRVVGYALKILCLVCSNTEEPHFQELEYCLKNKNMTCDKTGELITMPASNVQKLFAAGILHQSSVMDTVHQSSATATPHQSSATHTSHRPACSDKEFQELKAVVSQWYDSNKSVPLLKVLFRDKIDNYELSPETHTMDLLNILFARGHLSSQNLGLLCDTISITKQLGLLTKIKEKLPSFPDVEEGTISKTFTSHRQRLMKFGMVLTPDNVTQIDELYNTPSKKYKDGWSMINDLEDQQKVSEENMKEFTDSLKTLKLSLALNELT
ncbi:uncharacterized protein LOC117125574 [Anneissia japonica]|uniref:uncharacterized protein LOC117125574 n=1 Tax=Anneissia japonica TaxID=1529436 RepID=UPI001425766E|nr:uncharacterized protein LOC117125574 [Anneissia japonica]